MVSETELATGARAGVQARTGSGKGEGGAAGRERSAPGTERAWSVFRLGTSRAESLQPEEGPRAHAGRVGALEDSGRGGRN